MTATTIPCPDSRAAARRARPEGVHRLVLVFGISLANWARNRADQKALARTRHPLSALSDSERVELYREASQLRDQAYAGRANWHVIG
ncbi:MAG TPA: hypothetical protein VFT01_09935 [Homoserinimonas sp.]|nr:hypothetical protein [Homoserinimonas sp.]